MPAHYSENDECHSPDTLSHPPRHSPSDRTKKSSGSGGGLLSNVFSVVRREIEEFVVNATGGAEPSALQPVAGPSRERGGRSEKRQRLYSVAPQPQHDVRVLKRVRSDRDGELSTQLRSKDVVDYDEHAEDEALRHLSHCSASVCPRVASISMPGSLFSRSPTPDNQELEPHHRHVHFASDVISPVSRQRGPIATPVHGPKVDEDEEESQLDVYCDGGSSSPGRPDGPPLHRSSVQGSSSSRLPATPFRPPTIRSVKDAITRLEEDSPSRTTRPITRKSSAVCKVTEKGGEILVPSPVTAKLIVRPRLESMSRSTSTADVADGTGHADPFFRRDRRYSTSDPEGSGGRSTADDDGAKRRIRELEEEVKRLENELAKRPLPRDPPPPPPPPPPPESSTSRIPLSGSPRGSNAGGVYSSVRAGLRQTPNAPESSRALPTNRLPTVPTDKMEAFLSELRTVRLRKVGSAKDLSQSSSQGSSLQEYRATLGYKRKRADSGNEAQSALFTSIKRRFTAKSQPGTSTAAGSASSRTFLPPPHPSTVRNARDSISIPLVPDVGGTTPSLCSDNDNECEERFPSTPPLPPSRPLLLAAMSIAHPRVEVQAPREPRHQEPEIHDHTQEILEKAPPPRPQSQSSKSANSHGSKDAQSSQSTQETLRQDEDGDNPFSRRLPSSPIISETPRRPRPPARVRSTTKAASRPPVRSHSRSETQSAPDDGSDDDPLSRSFSLPDNESTPVPDPVGRRRKQRRSTLEDELRKANSSYIEEERAFIELESGTLIGVGEKSKQSGFLAHGGAGGEPVFISEGGVECVAGENVANEVDKKKKSKPAKRRPKR